MPAPRKPKEEMPAKVRKQVKLLKDSEVFNRRCAATVLGRIGHISAIPHLAKALKDREHEVRWNAVEALREINHLSTIPHLAGALQDSYSGVRDRAAYSLVVIGRSIRRKKVEGKEAKALQFVAPYFREREHPQVVQKVYEAALKGKITPENTCLYIKQLRALQGNLK